MKKRFSRTLSLMMAILMAVTVFPANVYASSAAAAAPKASKAVLVSSIKLSKSSANLAIGKTLLLTATVSPSNASNKAVTWSSSNSAVASTVLSTGFILTKSIGTAVITCKAKDGSGVSATCTIKVIPATPGSFVVARASSTSTVVSWKAVFGATGYEVYRYSPLLKTYTIVKITTSTSFVNTGLLKDKTYSYKVRAFKLVGLTAYYSDFTAVKTA